MNFVAKLNRGEALLLYQMHLSNILPSASACVGARANYADSYLLLCLVDLM